MPHPCYFSAAWPEDPGVWIPRRSSFPVERRNRRGRGWGGRGRQVDHGAKTRPTRAHCSCQVSWIGKMLLICLRNQWPFTRKDTSLAFEDNFMSARLEALRSPRTALRTTEGFFLVFWPFFSPFFRCIAKASGGSDGRYVVTSSENGEMFLWDTTDGRCVESRKPNPSLVHTHIQSYRSAAGTSQSGMLDSTNSLSWKGLQFWLFGEC